MEAKLKSIFLPVYIVLLVILTIVGLIHSIWSGGFVSWIGFFTTFLAQLSMLGRRIMVTAFSFLGAIYSLIIFMVEGKTNPIIGSLLGVVLLLVYNLWYANQGVSKKV